MAFKLSIEQGKGRGRAFDFDTAVITIGRAEENDVVLFDEQGVSRRHARISQGDGGCFLEDLESANGTLLNGAKVKKESLSEGDTIGIGAVVFRFGTGKAAAKSEDGSTRIVTLTKEPPRKSPKAEAAPAKPPAGGQAAALASPGESPLNGRIIAAGVAIAALLAVVFVLLSYRAANADKRGSCVDPISYDDRARLLAFGNVQDAVCVASKRVAFSFKPTTKARVILSYAPFYTDAGEVKVLLNDKQIETMPPSATRHGRIHSIVLSDTQVLENKVNVVAFVSDGKGEWGFDRFELVIVGKEEANQSAANAAYELGKRYVEQRYVASANLYKGWLEFRKAQRALEWVDPHPSNYSTILAQIEKAEFELDKLCADRLFGANKEARFGHLEQANGMYQFILAAFPGDEHACRTEAQRHIGSLVQAQQSSGG
jgi:pSer/pThr/pTyr-binding forkhead associated (FHA) protein